MKNRIRQGVLLVIFVLIPVLWWITIAPWQDCEFSVGRAAVSLLATALGVVVVYFLLGSQSTKEKGQSVALLLGPALFCLMLLEIPTLIGFNYQGTFHTSADNTTLRLSDGVNKPDPVLIHIHWPDSSFSGEVSGNLVQLGIRTTTRYQVDVRYDRNGFRNSRDFDRADIAVIGDSFVEAAIIARDKSLVPLLESRLSVPTINLGQINYGLRQESEVLKRFALPLSPKLVLWVLFGGNDLRDVESYERRLSRINEPEPPVPFVQKLFLRNALVAGRSLIVKAIKVRFQCPARHQSGSFRRSDGVAERVYFGQTADPWTPHDWQVAVDTLRDANHLANKSGAEFVVVYIPRKYRIYRSHISVSSDHDIARWEVSNLPEELEKWSITNGIKFVDTTPFLEALVANGVHPYFVDDVHWNMQGHETAVEAIVEYLVAERVFPFDSDKD